MAAPGSFPPDFVENYVRLRRKLILFFECKRCHAPCDELADEAFLRLTERLAKGTQIENIEKFTFGIAKYVFVDWIRRQRSPAVSSLVTALPPSNEALLLSECLAELEPDERELLEAYFLDSDRRLLAESRSTTIGALRKRVCLLKKRVTACMARCAETS